jgi:hypothetical protein
MFNYQPNQSRAGEFLAQGITNSAQIRAQADLDKAMRKHNMIVDGAGMVGDAAKKVAAFMVGGPAGAAMASGMGGGGSEGGGGGGLFDTIIGAYAKKEQDKSDSKIYGNLMKIVAPAFGKDGDSMLEQWNSLESDRDRAQFGGTLFSSLGQISNMYMANRNAGIRENAPFVGAGLKNAANIAGGNATYTPPAGMAPVEPSLPTGGPAPVGVAPAPVASGIPGGQASLDAINADRKRRGLPPIQ